MSVSYSCNTCRLGSIGYTAELTYIVGKSLLIFFLTSHSYFGHGMVPYAALIHDVSPILPMAFGKAKKRKKVLIRTWRSSAIVDRKKGAR